MKLRRILLAVGVVPLAGALIAVGCHRKASTLTGPAPATTIAATSRPSTTRATTRLSPAPASPGGTFAKFGIHLEYPAGWVAKPSQDLELLLTRDGGPGSVISLDVPDLPPHFPGMIPIGLVKGGYLDDLKKELGNVGVETSEESPTVAGVKGRLVTSIWQKDGSPMVETALILIHADRVYIVRARYPASGPGIRDAFDSTVHSIHW